MDELLWERLKEVLEIFAGIASVLGVLLTLWQIKTSRPVLELGHTSSNEPDFWAVFRAGFFVAVAQGVLWSVIDRCLGWHIRAGGDGPLAQGWSAVALSFTIWLPVVVLPPLTARRVNILESVHSRGAAGALVACTIAHLLLRGTDDRFFPGFCALARRWFAYSALISEIVTLFLYTISRRYGKTTILMRLH